MPNLYVTNLYIFVVWTCQIVNRMSERVQNKTFVRTVRFEHRFSRSLTSFKIILNILLTEFVSFRKLREGILRGSRANWNESSLHLTAILHPQRTTKSLWTFYFSRLLHYNPELVHTRYQKTDHPMERDIRARYFSIIKLLLFLLFICHRRGYSNERLHRPVSKNDITNLIYQSARVITWPNERKTSLSLLSFSITTEN